jgi:hypothetical protein
MRDHDVAALPFLLDPAEPVPELHGLQPHDRNREAGLGEDLLQERLLSRLFVIWQ